MIDAERYADKRIKDLTGDICGRLRPTTLADLIDDLTEDNSCPGEDLVEFVRLLRLQLSVLV